MSIHVLRIFYNLLGDNMKLRIKLAKFYNTSCDYLLGLTDISTPYTSIKNDNIR